MREITVINEKLISLWRSDRLIFIGLAISLGMSLAQILLFVYQHYIDLPGSSDQWGYYEPILNDRNLWEGFFHQRGSHFLGLGYFTSLLVGALSNYSVGAEGFLVAGLMAVNCLLVLWIKYRIMGRFHWSDLIIPPFFLNIAHAPIYLFLAHGSVVALPVMGAICFVFALLRLKGKILGMVLTILSFLCLFTGYAYVVSLLILLFSGFKLIKARKETGVWWTFLIIQISILVLFVRMFDIGQLGENACDKTNLVSAGFTYLVNLLRSFFHINAVNQYLVFSAFLVAIYLVLIWLWRAYLRSDWGVIKAVGGLLVFTMLYGVLNAAGRACQGPELAYARRYLPFLLPGFIAFYVVFLHYWDRGQVFSKAYLVVFLGLSAYTLMSFRETAGVVKVQHKISNWYQCYEAAGKAKECYSKSEAFQPVNREDLPAFDDMMKKLDALRHRKDSSK